MYELQPKQQPVASAEKPSGKVLIISGPTATGKTKLAISVAKALNGEVISADSMQVYRGMDIGTAKVTLAESQGIPHHLIDICDISEPHNVMDFYNEATHCAHDIIRRGKVPIVAGGTGFYIHALIYGPPQGPPSVPAIREKIEADMLKYGTERLYEKLREYDPEYAATVTHNDRHKIIRALEIIAITGKKVSDFAPNEAGQTTGEFDFHCWFVHLAKEVLYDRIDERTEEMIQQGFIEEVKRLESEGLSENLTAAGAIGYRQCLEYLKTSQTEGDYESFVTAFKRASRRYAKRQFTWFRKEPLFNWLNLSRYDTHQATEIIVREFEGR
ncbi:MAG: tRNA (adenosine(37)-N6)-dimethylallyltransferase MiaA [Chlamydiia bacterium]|nr:tRNA (adenosine(37)-N6)-dimethylallyltransferase MiaA [Chlamydiia bacterium]MCP5510072.1 tRNA (adenosine(37)-N6)-dimethylallyltransferase MiaA [Chlamydiales bacterium]HPE85065.1 tRNA (adenosine(37)-N6)-dimethylallyltransferase MiaA [Chlamydiales bacterium]